MKKENQFYKNGELKDKKIAAALKKAADGYENGEIAETHDILVEIVQAIQEWEKYNGY